MAGLPSYLLPRLGEVIAPSFGAVDPRTEKRRVTLKFTRTALLEDLAQYGFVAADVMKTDDEHDRHQVYDIVEDGNVDLVTRMLNLWIAECREKLYPLTNMEIADGDERINTFAAPEQYDIALNAPSNFSATTATYLEQLIHNYLIAKVLAWWMELSGNAPAAGQWKEHAEELLGKIESCRHTRTGIVRRRMHPFP